MKKEVAIRRFITQTPHKFELAEGDVRLSAVYMEIDTESGQALAIEPIASPSFVRRREPA